MGRVEFSTENKGNVANYDYPKLKLKNGEKARIIVGLEDPVMEYVHTLRKPQIVNGAPVTKMVTNEKTNVTTEEYVKDFVGNPICLGDAGIIKEKGMDPDHCPACKLATEHPDMADAPKRRFAMHVIRYRTKANSFAVSNPFSVEILVWSFTDMVFNKIVDAKEEWGDIRKHDFLLGPCTNELFQKFDISVGADAVWLKNDEHKVLVRDTFKENQIPDLTIAVGRSKQAAWVKQDVDSILEAWRQVHNHQSSDSSSSLGDDLNGLLDKKDEIERDEEGWAVSADEPEIPSAVEDISALKAEAKKATSNDEPDDFDDLLSSSLGVDTDGGGEETEAQDAPEKSSADEVDNFDALLEGM